MRIIEMNLKDTGESAGMLANNLEPVKIKKAGS
jgi:hypothetical protein